MIFILPLGYNTSTTQMNRDIHSVTFKIISKQVLNLCLAFPQLLQHFSDKPFKVIDTDIHPKILADWNRKGLLLVKPEPNKMHRFSLTEFVWVKMIAKMRQFNFPIETIKAFRNEMTQTPQPYIDEIKNDPRTIDLLVGLLGEDHREKLKIFMVDPKGLDRILPQLPIPLIGGNLLDLLIVFCILMKSPLSFKIDHLGKGILFNPMLLAEGVYQQDEIAQLMSSSFVSISLTEILAEVLSLAPVDVLNGQLMVITDQEANILTALREDELVSVVIRFDKNNRIDLMEIKKMQKMDPQTRLCEIMLKGGYQNIEIKTQHGKIVHCENTRKIKLK